MAALPDDYKKRRAPGHILVDEEYVREVFDAATSTDFPKGRVKALEGAECGPPDIAGLVALSWTSDQDPKDVVSRIRDVDNSLYDMVSPDHTVGYLGDPNTGEVGTSPEAGGPAGSPPDPAERLPDVPYRQDFGPAGCGVMVGVVDSGIRRHWWYEGAVLADPESFEKLDQNKDTVRDRQAGHGSFVTGLILRQAPRATVRVVQAFDPDGFVRTRDAAQAIVKLDRFGVDIINLSFGGYTEKNRMPLAHRKAFSKLRHTTVVVAAAGNHDPADDKQAAKKDRRFWPAAMNRVVAVAALKQVVGDKVELADFSNYGPWVTISAVGEDVLSTFVFDDKFNGWARWSGTSFAAPIVAGRIAAAMTDESGEIVRTAMQAKEFVLNEAKRRTVTGGELGPVLLTEGLKRPPRRPPTSA